MTEGRPGILSVLELSCQSWRSMEWVCNLPVLRWWPPGCMGKHGDQWAGRSCNSNRLVRWSPFGLRYLSRARSRAHSPEICRGLTPNYTCQLHSPVGSPFLVGFPQSGQRRAPNVKPTFGHSLLYYNHHWWWGACGLPRLTRIQPGLPTQQKGNNYI